MLLTDEGMSIIKAPCERLGHVKVDADENSLPSDIKTVKLELLEGHVCGRCVSACNEYI